MRLGKPCHDELEKVDKRKMDLFIPECKPDGLYKEKQCYGFLGHCWCVSSQTGKEVVGTRKNMGSGAAELTCGTYKYGLCHLSITCIKISG